MARFPYPKEKDKEGTGSTFQPPLEVLGRLNQLIKALLLMLGTDEPCIVCFSNQSLSLQIQLRPLLEEPEVLGDLHGVVILYAQKHDRRHVRLRVRAILVHRLEVIHENLKQDPKSGITH
jgi:hypothetical protein